MTAEADVRAAGIPRLVSRLAIGWCLMAIFEASTRMTAALAAGTSLDWRILVVTVSDAAGFGVGHYCAFRFVDRYPLDRVTWKRALVLVAPFVILLTVATLVVRLSAIVALGLLPLGQAANRLAIGVHGRIFAVFLMLGVAYAVQYYLFLRERIRAAGRLEAEVLRAQIRMLRAELQPHFLLNTLNAIAYEIRRSPRRAEHLIGRVGDLLRMSLDSVERQVATVAEEIEFVSAYLDLQRARLGDRLRTVIRVDNELLEATVPSFLLQPLVENAVRHGVEPSDHPVLVEIDIRRVGKSVAVEVSDDGAGLKEGPRHEGLGLRYTRERLARQYGTRASFALEPRTGGGARATVLLPL